MSEDNKNLLNEDQAAEMLGYSKLTLRTWRSMKKGPNYYKVGGRVRYDSKDLQEFKQGVLVVTDTSKDTNLDE